MKRENIVGERHTHEFVVLRKNGGNEYHLSYREFRERYGRNANPETIDIEYEVIELKQIDENHIRAEDETL